MQIKLGSTVLADDNNNRVVDAWQGPAIESYVTDHQVQTVMPIRSSLARLVPRNNASGTISFTTTRVCPSLSAAGDLLTTWHLACPKSGTLTVGSRVYKNAALVFLRTAMAGVQVTASYNIQFEVQYA